MTISVLIPAHNEEKSLRRCIESVLAQTCKPDQVVVVNDGSSDKTEEIIESFGDKVTQVKITKPTGNKSYAQEVGLWFITGDIFITTDADTIIEKHFIERAIRHFSDSRVASVSGYVRSLKYNWLTASREIDYIVGQNIHKLAQSYINFLMVIPGCAAAFRTEVFRQEINFDHDTVTEDMDFTYKLHKSGKKIIYDRQAIVYTQDPADIKSYINQMRRWYGGGWQNLVKHYRLINKPAAALEFSIGYIEGIVLPFLAVFLLLVNIKSFLYLALIYIASIMILTIYAAIQSRRYDLILYFPSYTIISILNSYIFISEFIKEVIRRERKLIWLNTSRREII